MQGDAKRVAAYSASRSIEILGVDAMSVVNMDPLALVWKVFMQHAAPNMTKSLSVFSTVRVHTKSDDIFGQPQQLG